MSMEDYERYARHAKLCTSLHALKSRSPTALTKGQRPNNVVISNPLTPCSINKDSSFQGYSANVSSTKFLGVAISPAPKKANVATTKMQASKKKIMDPRKRGLKRL